MTKIQSIGSTITLLVITACANAQTTYFPAGTFDTNARYDRFVRGWYSAALKAAEEPSLFAMARSKSAQSYRFLWLRSFNDTVSIRLDIHPDGTATLVEKIVGDRMSPTPGKITYQETKTISADRTRSFLNHLSDGHFWELPTDIHHDGCDGAEWVIEGVHDGTYHIAMRWSPESGLIHDLGMELVLELADMKIPKKEIY